jgi:hypothetical protein
MNLGQMILDWTLRYEARMDALGLLPVVEGTTIWWKLWATTLERSMRPKND